MCSIPVSNETEMVHMATTLIQIAAAHGFSAIANADGSVGIIIPTTRNGAFAGNIVETVRTVRETYDALGY